MIKKIMKVMSIIHEHGLDANGLDSLRQQIPYWTQFLDGEYNTLDYPDEVTFVKELGYRVFRNSDGKHKLLYE